MFENKEKWYGLATFKLLNPMHRRRYRDHHMCYCVDFMIDRTFELRVVSRVIRSVMMKWRGHF
jgi:hypothetical protein